MRKQMRRGVIAVSVAALAGVLFLLSPFFSISVITVNGGGKALQDDARARLSGYRYTNIFLFQESEARRKLLENYYIEQVQFERKYPGELVVTMRESLLSGYVEYMRGSFLYIDENGRVLEANTFLNGDFPVVSGLRFDRFRLGETLEVEDPASFGGMVKYAALLNQYGLASDTARIDVSNPANIRIYIHRIEFSVGDIQDADEKVRTIVEILKNLPDSEVVALVVNLEKVSGLYFAKILT